MEKEIKLSFYILETNANSDLVVKNGTTAIIIDENNINKNWNINLSAAKNHIKKITNNDFDCELETYIKETIEFDKIYNNVNDTDNYDWNTCVDNCNNDNSAFTKIEWIKLKDECAEFNNSLYGINFAMKLKSIRMNKGRTIKATSEFLGVPQRTYEDWEGEKRVPDMFKQSAVLDKLQTMKNK